MPATATDRLAGLVTSVAVKPPCAAVTSFDIPLTGLFTVSGVALEEGDRVLVRAQSDATENGIYNASTSDWTRALDFDGARDVVCGTLVLVRNSIADGAMYEVTTPDEIVIDDSLITFDLRDDPTIIYAQTQVEIDAGAVPVALHYPVDPADPRRYGADPTNNPASASVTTAAVITAMNVAYRTGGSVFIGFGCIYCINPIVFLMNKSATCSLRIMGQAMIGCGFSSASGTTSLLTFCSSTPYLGNTLVNSYLSLENFSLYGPGTYVSTGITGTNGLDGITLQGLANAYIRNVRVTLFDGGLELKSSLNLLVRDCDISENAVGIVVDFVGTFPTQQFTANLIRIENCTISLNTTRAIDYNGGTGLYVVCCDIETNGQSGTTAGGIWIKGQTSPDAQEGHVVLERNWFESNNGWTVLVDAQTNSSQLRVTFRSNEMFNAQSGQFILVNGAYSVLIEDQMSAVTGTYRITCTYGTFRNTFPATWDLTGVTVPIVENCGIGYEWGLQSQFTLTYVGVSGGPVTNLVNVWQQGMECAIVFTDVQGASSSTALTATGWPTKFQPSSAHYYPAILQDNSVDVVGEIVVSNSGTVSFFKPGAFTASGQKGVRRAELRMRLSI